MELDDLVLVSIDDHVIEPVDVFERHLPAARVGDAPRVVTVDGRDRWIFQGAELGPGGLNAVASWPKDEWDNEPVGYAEMRPGCYDVHARVRDMDANGVMASMNFPTFPGFAGTHLMRAPDRMLASMVVSAYNDWHIDEWCGAAPERFLPLAILPAWSIEDSVAEVHRCGRKGFAAVTMPETPYAIGLPSYYTDHWDPVLQALCDEDMAMCLHIGGAYQLLRRPDEAPLDERIILSPQLSAVACTDMIVGGVLNRFPSLRVAMSEGGIGWIAPLLDRMDLHLRNQTWTGLDLGGRTATEVFRNSFLGCFITNPSSLRLRDRIGVESIAWECDYPHSDTTWPRAPEVLWEDFEAAGVSDDERHLIAWKNACRFFRFDPFAKRPQHEGTVGALRARATNVDVSTTSRAEYRRRYEAVA
jgi:predicted TIM-barrel fold metal-dependent hydrolase